VFTAGPEFAVAVYVVELTAERLAIEGAVKDLTAGHAGWVEGGFLGVVS
jgi:hypothetical protein